ncbi:MAG: ECF transporter S component [Oscillospiraceae bacterium]
MKNKIKTVKTQKQKSNDIFFIVSMAIFLAILAIMAYTPLGALNLGFTTATLAHIPVIIGAIVYGKKAGLILGSCFGLLSVITFSTVYAGQPIGYVFSPVMAFSLNDNITISLMLSLFALITAFLPRVLMGLITAKTFDLSMKITNNQDLSIIISATVGSISHTAMFYACFFGLFYTSYLAGLVNMSDIFSGALAILTIITGLVEAILAAILSIAVTKPLKKLSNKKR